jgi:hypothetical protein
MKSAVKFLFTAGSNLSISSVASYIIVDYYHNHHYFFIAFNIMVLPIISFLVMKLWIFRN